MAKLGTRLSRPHAQQDATLAAATRYLERTGNADLLPILGLADEPETDRPACPACGNPLSRGKHGGYRPCQRRTCQGGAR